MDEQQQQVLQQVGRPGWRVVGTKPETKKVTSYDANNRSVETDQPTGNEVWSIVGPDGQPDEITVQQHYGPEEQAGYTVVSGPKNTPTKPAQPAAPQNDRPGYQSYTDKDGNLYESWSGTPWHQAKDAQGNPIKGKPAADTKPAPTPLSGYQPFKGPNGNVIAYVDPADPTNRIPIPQDQPDKLPDGTTKDTIDAGRTVHWVAKSGQWTISGLGDSLTPQDAKPKDGDTRNSVIPGTQYIGTEVYHNGVWSIDTTAPPKPYIPTDKPTEGDVRPNVKDGQSIQEVYRGGSWVVDSSVPPRPFGPQTPTTVNAPTTQPNIVSQTPGQPGVQTTPNPNYQPSDIAGRVSQLKQQAQSKRDELNQQIASGQKSAEQAAGEFDAWWSANVDPFSSQLQQQQAQQQQDAQIKANQEARAQQAAEQSAFTAAHTAGQDAVRNQQALLPYMVGPGYGAAVNQIANAYASGKKPGNIDIGSAVTFQAPDFSAIAEQATAQALAHLSPTAAGKVGAPMPQMPQGIDIPSVLNKTQYAPSVTVHPDGTVQIQHQQPPPPQPDLSTMLPNYVPNAGTTGGLDYALPPMTY